MKTIDCGHHEPFVRFLLNVFSALPVVSCSSHALLPIDIRSAKFKNASMQMNLANRTRTRCGTVWFLYIALIGYEEHGTMIYNRWRLDF